MSTGQDSFWGRLAPAERKAIEGVSARRRYAAGDYLCHEGDQTKHVIVVLSGHVQVIGHTTDDREVVMGMRSAGDIVGEMAALYDQPRVATLQALDSVEAFTLHSTRFTHLCQTRAKLAWALLGVMYQRFGEWDRQRAEYGAGTASSRVYAQLAQIMIKDGRPNGSGVEIRPGLTQQQLADRADTSRESYARALRGLRDQGIISTGRGWIVVHKPDELRRLAQ